MTLEVLSVREQEAMLRLLEKCDVEFRSVMRALDIDYWHTQSFALVEKGHYLVWCQTARRYRVPFQRVVKLVVMEYRNRLSQRGDRLGVKMSTLVSIGAQAWLNTVLASSNGHNTTQYLPRRYNSVEEYNETMVQLRRKYTMVVQTRKYRSTSGWVFPKTDAVRQMFSI